MKNTLNQPQALAVKHFQGPCMILAGPGSGKTFVITQRTVNLIKEYGVDPSNILVITFTRAAANEMKQRFQKLMNGEGKSVTFGTFHSVYFMVLKYAYHFQAANIITDEKKYQFMRQLLTKYKLEYDDESELIGGIFREISMIKNTRIPLENFYSSSCGEEIFRGIYEDYHKLLHSQKLIDFDDMLLYTYELFCARKDILMAWQKKYRYILVDEFQDINQLQYDILKMLSLPENNLFIVGDDDQSIYRFRGSKPEIMLGFEKDYPGARKILLDRNYRCQKNIVEASLNLISYNKERFDKQIFAGEEAQAPVRILDFLQQKEQNLFVIQEIGKAIQNGADYKEFAVLFRTNTQPRLLMEQMMEYNIPFKTKEQIPNLYDHWIAKDIFTYIRIAHGSRERADFLQIVNRPKRYIGRESMQNNKVDIQEWERYYNENKQPWIAERIRRFSYELNMLTQMSPYAAVNYIRKGIGYDSYLKEFAKYRHIKLEDLTDILDELQGTAKGYKSYEQWMDQIEKLTEEMQKQESQKKNNPDAVTLATLHSSKGLEFDQVYILDVNEGIMPYKKAVLVKELEEERRMFYVGMTRAKRKLTLCSVQNLNNKTMEGSRFLKECVQRKDEINHPFR